MAGRGCVAYFPETRYAAKIELDLEVMPACAVKRRRSGRRTVVYNLGPSAPVSTPDTMSVLPSPSYDGFNAQAGPSCSYSPHHASPVHTQWRDMPSYSPFASSQAGPSTLMYQSSSASSSVDSIRQCRRLSRPLPAIPVTSAPATPISPSLSPYPRPLPTPPIRVEPPSPSLCSPIRPLPKPTTPKLNTTNLNPPPRPTLSLIVNTPGTPTAEIVLDMTTPLSPISPVVFSKDESPTEMEVDMDMDMEESVARRLSTMGFVEIERARSRSPSTPPSESESPRPRQQRTPTPRSSAEASRASHESVERERRDDVEIRVELVSAAAEKRASRLWIFEKKGKRWIERNYDEILLQLRKL